MLGADHAAREPPLSLSRALALALSLSLTLSLSHTRSLQIMRRVSPLVSDTGDAAHFIVFPAFVNVSRQVLLYYSQA